MDSIIIPLVILAAFFALVAMQEIPANLSSLEKQITIYFTDQGYAWKKEDEIIYVRRSGTTFRIGLKEIDNIKSSSLWIQYATKLDEDLEKVQWAGQTAMVNALNDRHPRLNICIMAEDSVLWAQYRADIRSKKEFIFHFDGAYYEMQALMRDFTNLLPQLQADYPSQDKQHKPIGFA